MQGEPKRRAPGSQRFTAYLGRVPPNVNENVIRYIFSQCGNILDIRWQQDKVSGAFKGYLLVHLIHYYSQQYIISLILISIRVVLMIFAYFIF